MTTTDNDSDNNLKRQLTQIVSFINNSQIIEYIDNSITTYDIKTQTLSSIPLHDFNDYQLSKILTAVYNHNVEFVKFSSNVLKQHIMKLKASCENSKGVTNE